MASSFDLFSQAHLTQALSAQKTKFRGHNGNQENVEHWVYLIGRSLDHEICAVAVEYCERENLEVLTVMVLSNNSTDWPAAVKIGLTGEVTKLVQQLPDHSTTLGVDCLIQDAELDQTPCKFACFDMDSTLIKAEVIDELAKLAGVGKKVADITERAMRGELDFNQSFTARMALLEGLEETVLESVANQLEIMDGAETLLRNLRQHGVNTAIFSGGFQYFAKVLQGRFGFDHVYANFLDICNGELTGQVREPIINADAKARLLQEMAQKYNIAKKNCLAVGDGANDLLMLGQAGRGVAFRAKPIVRQQAQLSINHNSLEAILFLLGFTQDTLV